MRITVYNEYGRLPFAYRAIVRDLSTAFPAGESADLILVSLSRIHELNLAYRHLDRPTDVISFEDPDGEGYLGDIFLSVEKACAQAKEYHHSREREFAFLLVHGLLHVHGYDHRTPEEERVMFAKQDEILERLGYTK